MKQNTDIGIAMNLKKAPLSPQLLRRRLLCNQWEPAHSRNLQARNGSHPAGHLSHGMQQAEAVKQPLVGRRGGLELGRVHGVVGVQHVGPSALRKGVERVLVRLLAIWPKKYDADNP